MRLDMRQHETPGLLITFCGLDGCGKSTQISRLKEWLEGMDIPVRLTKQPTDFVRRSAIFRSYMDQPNHDEFDYRALSLLCASDRVQHANRVIRPLLEEGKTVISDRYFYSCLAHLRARGYRRDLWIYEVVRSIPKPDVAFFLDVDVDTAVCRVRGREAEKNRYIDLELQHRLRREYLSIAAENSGVVVATGQSEEESFRQIQEAVMRAVRYV